MRRPKNDIRRCECRIIRVKTANDARCAVMLTAQTMQLCKLTMRCGVLIGKLTKQRLPMSC